MAGVLWPEDVMLMVFVCVWSVGKVCVLIYFCEII